MSYLRIAGAIAAAALLGFLWWRVSLSFSQGDIIDEQRGHIAGLEAGAARDRRIATEIAAFRGQQSDAAAAFREELAKKNITREVRYVDPKTGVATTCRERDPVRYRSLYNAAVTGTADGVP